MKVYLLYPKYYDFENQKYHIGGVETYITNLLQVLTEMQISTVLVQLGAAGHLRLNEYVEIHSLDRMCSKKNSMLHFAEKHGDLQRDILVFMSSSLAEPSKFRKVVGIQHGIAFDLPWVARRQLPDFLAGYIQFLRGRLRIYKHRYINKLVCVDYNYMNWLRTQSIDRHLNYAVIPNFTEVPSELPVREKREEVRIVFARRVEEIRGAKLIVGVFKALLGKYNHITITIAGTGSCLDELKQIFAGESRVKFTSYASEESVPFHQQFDIALVPSIGSEGTSLSLLEAMAAGCAVLATDVGGMTNIILNGYNGLLCSPREDDCVEKLSQMIESRELRKKLSAHGYETASEAFSLERWKAAWKKVFEEYIEEG